MPFNSREYEWADITLMLGGVDITRIRAVKYATKAEKEALYGKGRKPVAIQTGNESTDGEFGVTQSELIALQKAGNGSILGLSLDAVVSYGNPSLGDAMTTDRIVGVSFTEEAKEIKQGDKFMEVKLPFIALGVKPNV